jgi:hypothetical protein
VGPDSTDEPQVNHSTSGGASFVVASPPPEAIYNALWFSYRDGARTHRTLATRCGVGVRLARTAIEYGWPANDWAPLKARLDLWERQASVARTRAAEEDRRAAEAAGKTDATRRREAQAKQDTLLDQLEEICLTYGKRLGQAASMATFVRYRKVPVRKVDPSGKVYFVDEVQPWVDATSFAKGLSMWAGAVKDIPSLRRMQWAPLGDEPLPAFTPEQLEQLARGELPDGVSEAMVGAALQAAMKAGGNE